LSIQQEVLVARIYAKNDYILKNIYIFKNLTVDILFLLLQVICNLRVLKFFKF